MRTFDAVVVGARCGGSTIAGQLARAGWKVLLVDRATFPSDTTSTHLLFPNSVARLAHLGILERLHDAHRIHEVDFGWTILGHDLSGTQFTPIDGFTKSMCVRRIALDQVFVDWAIACGAIPRFATKMTGLIGGRDPDDPVRGITLEGGEEVHARWVIGADGRASTVAAKLGLPKLHERSGDLSFLLAYYTGLPDRPLSVLHVRERSAIMWSRCQDDIHLVSLGGPPELTRGDAATRMRSFEQGIRAWPEVIDPADIDKAERVSDLVVVPETMMRGFFKQASGPGWALIGDAGHFKHPATAQGISDAIEQAVHVADSLNGDDPELSGYESWRDARAEGHYEMSFRFGRWPRPEVTHPYLAGMTSDPQAMQDWTDTFTRLKRPAEVDTPERLARWLPQRRATTRAPS